MYKTAKCKLNDELRMTIDEYERINIQKIANIASWD
jgi:hypothetical protein